MLDWLAVEDGFVIEKRMMDFEVWLRCQLFGAPALITALENYIKTIEGQNDKTMVSKLVVKKRPSLS